MLDRKFLIQLMAMPILLKSKKSVMFNVNNRSRKKLIKIETEKN